jgi:hypothetical protein
MFCNLPAPRPSAEVLILADTTALRLFYLRGDVWSFHGEPSHHDNRALIG